MIITDFLPKKFNFRWWDNYFLVAWAIYFYLIG
jgi:hypothetical protein